MRDSGVCNERTFHEINHVMLLPHRAIVMEASFPEHQAAGMINPHQRCGYSDSPFVRIHYFYTAGSGNGLEGMVVVCPPKLILRKRHVFLIEKYIEDARQDEKHVPNLLEPIIQPPGLVKEELWRILLKMNQF